MKKRYLATTFLLAIALSGCGKTTTVEMPDDTETNSSEVYAEYVDNNEQSADMSEYEDKDSKEILLYSQEIDQAVYVNGEGELINKIDISNYSDYENDVLVKIYGNRIFYYNYSTDEQLWTIFVEDISSGSRQEMFVFDDFKYMDFYEDKMVIVHNDNTGEACYETYYDPDTYEEITEGGMDFTVIAGYSPVTRFDDKLCLEKMLANRGMLVLFKEDQFYKFDGETITAFETPEGVGKYDVTYSAGDCLVYPASSASGRYNDELHIYNIETNVDEKISSNLGNFLMGDGKDIYWTEIDDTDYGRDEYTLIEYNLENETLNKLFSEKKLPGRECKPIASGFAKEEDDIYFIGNDSTGTIWKKYNKANCEISNVGEYLTEYAFDEFGTVEYENNTLRCPDCNEPLYKMYDEYFVLNDKLVKGEIKDKINEQLKSKAVQAIDSMEANAMYLGDEYGDGCEYHGTTFNMETSEDRITEVYPIGTNYVAINKSGYWYGGGAHGMPTVACYVYDLTTGEEIEIRDVFTGEESELKDIVATATMADFDSTEGDYGYYFPTESQECYQMAYDLISFEYFPAKWNKDGITVMYPPYEMGPFASGYICVDISYETLGIKDKMIGAN